MKRFEVYRNIRKRAMIFGLPVSLFALMMVAILAGLLIIIFSFSLLMVLGVFSLNAILYIGLSRFAHNPQLLQFSKVFPQIISNRKLTALDYE